MGLWIGGNKAWKRHVERNILVAFHWINGERSMVLFPAHPGAQSSAYVICDSAAYKYAGNDGYPSKESAELFAKIVDVLGLIVTRQALFDVKEVVMNNIPDLIRMPPEPDWESDRFKKGDVGEATLKVDGETVSVTPV